MSGFIGILCLDGGPVDRTLLERMTRSMAVRGPDAIEIWCEGSVGLGHAMLRTTRESAKERQPAQLDRRLWIVADARIDARAELISKLKAKSPSAQALSLSTPDAELILHAYDVWGGSCVDHLLGDFSFAVWDTRKKHLFCARDQFGVKPFYYAQSGAFFIFSNSLDCIRMHPAVSSELNDLAIADFLLFDGNQDPNTTTFADIQRLPDAHLLSVEQGAKSIRRYWELSVTTPIHFSRDEEYIERFRELLDLAVSDRMRTDRAGIMLSGGLDSTTVAASARRISSRNGTPVDLRGYTEVFKHLIPHEEGKYATIAADALQMPIEFLVSDDWKIFQLADRPERQTPEPTHTAWPNITHDLLSLGGSQNRVILTGYGADPALSGRITVHFRELIKRMQVGRALHDAARYFFTEGRLSRLYLKKRWRLLIHSKKNAAGYPPWLNEDFESRWKLRDRFEHINHGNSTVTGFRQEAIDNMLPAWTDLFEAGDPGVTHVPVEIRHPFFDLRLASFLIALPRFPWCSDKELLREAGRGALPEKVRLRRKSTLPGDPLIVLLKRPESAWVDRFEPIPELEKYVERSRIPKVVDEKDLWTGWVHLRPLSLNFWLRGLYRHAKVGRRGGEW